MKLTWQDFQNDLFLTAGAFVVFFILDLILKRVLKWFVDDNNGRYFTLHVVCNAFVTIACLDDLYYTYSDPLTGISNFM